MNLLFVNNRHLFTGFIGMHFGFDYLTPNLTAMKRATILGVMAAMILAGACQPLPESRFIPSKKKVELGEEIAFYNQSRNAVEYEWDFGDGSYSTLFEPTHVYDASGVFTVILTAWSRSGQADKSYFDIEVVAPVILEVEVLEYYDQYPVAGASVILYPSERDWDNETNAVVEGFTNSSGKVIFTNLKQQAYFIDVWHPTHNNYTLRAEDVGFIRTDRLTSSQLNHFIAWVDYVGDKKGAAHDRNVLVKNRGRSVVQTAKK